jgi:hypothetical protein
MFAHLLQFVRLKMPRLIENLQRDTRFAHIVQEHGGGDRRQHAQIGSVVHRHGRNQGEDIHAVHRGVRVVFFLYGSS